MTDEKTIYETAMNAAEDLAGQTIREIHKQEDRGRDTGNLYDLLEAIEALQETTKKLGGLKTTAEITFSIYDAAINAAQDLAGEVLREIHLQEGRCGDAGNLYDLLEAVKAMQETAKKLGGYTK